MKLNRPVRNTHRSGSILYGVVEHTAIGHATVRVGGTRLTNLPVLGSAVNPGDTVIVDYATEGVPYVRPTTIPSPEVTEATTPSDPTPEPIPTNTGFVAGKIKHTASQEVISYVFPGTSWQSIQLGTTVYEYGSSVVNGPVDYLPAGYKGLRATVAGTYFCRLSVAATRNSGNEDRSNTLKIGIRTGYTGGQSAGLSGLLPLRIQRFNGPVGTQVISVSGFWRLGLREYIVPRIRVENGYPTADNTTLPALDNVYPTLEFVLVAKTDPRNPKAAVYWYYE